MEQKKKKMEPVVVNTCDQWKSYSSFRLVGVYTNRADLSTLLMNLLKENIIEVDEDFNHRTATLRELDDNVEFLHFNQINLNENLL